MNIAYFTDTYKPTINGIVTSVALFAQALRRQGHRVCIFGPSAPGHQEPDYYPFRCIRLPRVEPDYRLGIPLSAKYMRQFPHMQVDVVHCHTAGPVGMLGLACARLNHLPAVMTYHTLNREYARLRIPPRWARLYPLIDQVDEYFSNHFHLLLAPSSHIADYLRGVGVRSPVEVLPTGLDLTDFAAADEDTPDAPGTDATAPSRPPELAAIPPGAPVIGCACRVAVEKNLSFLLRVYARLHASHPDLYFALIGGGGYLDAIRGEAVALGLGDRFVSTGPVPHSRIPALLRQLDIFTYACQTDTQGLVVIEAMATARPLVLGDVPTYRPFVAEGENGYLLPLDEARFAATLAALLADDAQRRRLGARSAEMATQWSIDHHATRLAALYAQTASRVR